MVVISLFPSLLRLSSPSFSPSSPPSFFPLPYFFSDPSSTSFAYPPSFHDFSVPFIFIAPRVPSLLWCLIFLPFTPPLASPPSFLPSQIFSALTPLSQCEARTSCEALSVSTAPESCAFLFGKSAEIFKTD